MELLLWTGGFGLGLAIGFTIRPRRQTRAGIHPEPLPCVLFERDTSPAERVRWMRWMVDHLEAKQAKVTGADRRWIEAEQWKRASSSRGGLIASAPWVGICSNEEDPISVVTLSPVVLGGERFASHFEMSSTEELVSFMQTLQADRPITVACDRWRNVNAADALHQAGINVVKMPITIANLSEPTLRVQEAVKQGRLIHDGSPVLAKHIDNVTLRRVPYNKPFPARLPSAGSINGALALVMAMKLAIEDERQQAGSVGEEREA